MPTGTADGQLFSESGQRLTGAKDSQPRHAAGQVGVRGGLADVARQVAAQGPIRLSYGVGCESQGCQLVPLVIKCHLA
jgi:hypothetical protein